MTPLLNGKKNQAGVPKVEELRRNRASAIREVLKLGAKKMGRLLMIGRMEAGLMHSAIVHAPFLFFSFVSS